jgi:glycosyltransferase involved in cell wall biosynthesis
MTDRPPVSVVIPAYNAADFIEETVRSALAQTWPVAEVLVVDDGSTDATGARVDALSAEDRRVRRIRQPNSGIAATRNHGAAVARSEWLAWLDADDLWEPTKLARQLGAWDGRSAILYTDRRNFGDVGPLPPLLSDHVNLPSGEVFEALLLEGNFITTSSVVQTKASWQAVGGYSTDPRIPVCEDWDFWLQLTARCETAQCIRAPLTHYRIHVTGNSRSPERMTTARLAVVRRALATSRGAALPLATRQRILGQTLRTNAWDFHRHGFRRQAVLAAMQAVAAYPAAAENLKELLRVSLR